MYSILSDQPSEGTAVSEPEVQARRPEPVEPVVNRPAAAESGSVQIEQLRTRNIQRISNAFQTNFTFPEAPAQATARVIRPEATQQPPTAAEQVIQQVAQRRPVIQQLAQSALPKPEEPSKTPTPSEVLAIAGGSQATPEEAASKRETPSKYPSQTTGKPLTLASGFPDWDYFLGGIGGGGGTTVLEGLTIGASASPVTVTTYPSGSQGAPGAQQILVNILGILPTEIVPDGIWISGINQFTDPSGNTYYEATLPLWVG
jgi:hypothetical protein